MYDNKISGLSLATELQIDQNLTVYMVRVVSELAVLFWILYYSFYSSSLSIQMALSQIVKN